MRYPVRPAGHRPRSAKRRFAGKRTGQGGGGYHADDVAHVRIARHVAAGNAGRACGAGHPLRPDRTWQALRPHSADRAVNADLPILPPLAGIADLAGRAGHAHDAVAPAFVSQPRNSAERTRPLLLCRSPTQLAATTRPRCVWNVVRMRACACACASMCVRSGGSDPWTPTGPLRPGSPTSPCAPGSPASPGWPSGPARPIVPSSPGLPGTPGLPGLPGSPGPPASDRQVTMPKASTGRVCALRCVVCMLPPMHDGQAGVLDPAVRVSCSVKCAQCGGGSCRSGPASLALRARLARHPARRRHACRACRFRLVAPAHA